MEKGHIVIELEGITFEETQRYREIIHLLIGSGALNIRNGKTILHWDQNALQGIETDVHLWKRGKSPPLQTETRVAIEPRRSAQTRTTSGQI